MRPIAVPLSCCRTLGTSLETFHAPQASKRSRISYCRLNIGIRSEAWHPPSVRAPQAGIITVSFGRSNSVLRPSLRAPSRLGRPHPPPLTAPLLPKPTRSLRSASCPLLAVIPNVCEESLFSSHPALPPVIPSGAGQPFPTLRSYEGLACAERNLSSFQPPDAAPFGVRLFKRCGF